MGVFAALPAIGVAGGRYPEKAVFAENRKSGFAGQKRLGSLCKEQAKGHGFTGFFRSQAKNPWVAHSSGFSDKRGFRTVMRLSLNMPENLTRPKECRLRRKSEYSKVYGCGERLHTRNFLVFALARPESQARLGLAVTRKAGPAVSRNRIKRVLREFFRLHRQGLPGMDIVITPKRHLNPGHVCLGMAERELLPLVGKLCQLSVRAEATP